jgi:hypothetical protein
LEHSSPHAWQICAHAAHIAFADSLARAIAAAATAQMSAQSMSSAMHRAIILTSCSWRQDEAQWLQASAHS